MKEKIYVFLKGLANEKGIALDEDADLFENGVLDSLGIVQLLVYLNEEIGIQLNLETLDSESFRTLSDINEYLSQ